MPISAVKRKQRDVETMLSSLSHRKKILNRAKVSTVQEKIEPSDEVWRYANDLAKGKQDNGKRNRQQAKRWLRSIKNKNADYRPEDLDEIAKWAYRNLVFADGLKEGQPYTMEPYHLWVVAMTICTYKPDTEYYFYRKLYFATGKSSGKTSVAAVIAILLLAHPKYRKLNLLLPIVAANAEQGRATLFGDMRAMLMLSRKNFPEISVNAKEITNTETRSRCEAFSRDARRSKSGIKAFHVIVEEYGEVETRDIIAQARGGLKTTKGQTWYLLNGGRSVDDPAYQDYQTNCAILDKVESGKDYIDDEVCIVINQMEAVETDEDLLDPKEHLKACPTLGITCLPDYYMDEAKNAVLNTAERINFVRLWGCRFAHDPEGWLDTNIWDSEIVDHNLTYEDFRDKHELFLGTDLSKVGDLTSYWVLAQDGVLEGSAEKTEDGRGLPKYIGFCRVFSGQGNKGGLKAKFDKEKILDYPWMADQKYLLTTGTEKVDFAEVARVMMDDVRNAKEVHHAYDNQYKSDFDEKAAHYGTKNLKEYIHPQSKRANVNKEEFLSMSRSIRCAENLFNERRLRVMYNPIVTHALNGAIIQITPDGGFKGFGRNPKAKYDSAVALAMVCGMANLIWKQGLPVPNPDDDKTPDEIMSELGFL